MQELSPAGSEGALFEELLLHVSRGCEGVAAAGYLFTELSVTEATAPMSRGVPQFCLLVSRKRRSEIALVNKAHLGCQAAGGAASVLSSPGFTGQRVASQATLWLLRLGCRGIGA